MGGSHSHSFTGGVQPVGVRWVLLVALAPFAVATLVALVVLWPERHHFTTGTNVTAAGGGRVDYVTGVITDVARQPCGDGTTGTPQGAGQNCVTLSVRLSQGPDTGLIVDVSVGNAGTAPFAAGQKVRLAQTPDPTSHGSIYTYDDVVRDAPLGWLAAAFAVIVVAVARWRGAAALAGLGVTYLVLVEFLLPALLDGHSPVAAGLTAAAAILFVVVYLAHGVSARTSAALLGTLLSLALTGLLAAASIAATHLTGLSSETTSILGSLAGQVSVSGLMLCGLVIGSLGVLNDATVTQASAVWELHGTDPGLPASRLYRSAMRIGRDHIASTIYTLVLAYAGSALPVLLLFSLSGRTAHDVLTGDEIAAELVRGMIGGIGIAASIPITTAVAVLTVTPRHRTSRTRPAIPPIDVHPGSTPWSTGHHR